LVIRKILVTALAAALLQLAAAGLASAQDFATDVSSAATANNLWVTQIATAAQATTLAQLQAANATALATGQREQTLLQAALAIAPDDASRSRVQGVLNHVTAALQSGQQKTQATTLDAARGFLDAERGEAVEAQSEIVPFAPPPTQLPVSGSLPIALPFAIGFVSLVSGVLLRR